MPGGITEPKSIVSHSAISQIPMSHAMMALSASHARLTVGVEHPPQCATSVVTSVSQPFDGSPSQSANGAVHERTSHWPHSLQRPAPLAIVQTLPQPPQFAF